MTTMWINARRVERDRTSTVETPKTKEVVMVEASRMQTAAGAKQPAPLRISRAFPAPRGLLFRAWSSADHVKRWFSPETYTVPDARVHLHVGGPFEVRMRGPYGQERLIRGAFVEVVRHDRLVIDMAVADAEGRRLFKARTEVTFADDPIGARMDVVQTFAFVDPAMAAPMVWGASEGWRTTLDKLEKEVVRMRGCVAHATFRLERTYDATVQRVWAAITEAAAKSKWFGGGSGRWEQLERHMDVRVGGRERLRGRWKDGTVSTFDAAYYDVIPNERLVYAYEMRLDDTKISVSLATVELKAEGARTTLMITEQGAFLDGYDDAGAREHGTSQLLDALGASLKD
jgi:uncharacterized protein YndB with AHSA1/START domain